MSTSWKTILRPLTTEDLPAIAEICQDVHKGLDRFPLLVESWIAEDSVHTLGLEQNGVLLAVHTAHIVDDGQTAVLMGLRVHMNHRRRGIGSLVASATLELVRRQVPTVRRFRTTFGSYNTPQARITADWKQIFSSAFFSLEFTQEILQSRPISELLLSDAQLKPVSCEELCTALLSERLSFLPNTFLCVNQSFTPSRSNLRISVKDGCQWLVQRSEDGNVISISVGSFVSCPKFQMWTCNIYSCSEESVYFQAIEQLKHASRSASHQPFIFKCCTPEEFASSAGKMIQKMAVLKRGPHSLVITEKLLD